MRSVILAASVALVFGSASALAQAPRVTTTNAVGTNGSTVTTSNNSGSGATTGSASSTTSSTLANEPQVTAPSTAGASTGTSSSSSNVGSGSAFGTNSTTNVPMNSTPSFGPGGSFSNDSGNTALGLSPGQTSSGTAAGNSSQGLGAGSATLDPSNTGALGSGPAVTNPDGTTLGTGVNVVGERVPVQSGAAVQQQSPSFSIINTPTFDQAAREGRAKEQARKARGIEPRVYGIAPRTENDLTHQMPDDKIIRY